jgi:hypothetical protein
MSKAVSDLTLIWKLRVLIQYHSNLMAVNHLNRLGKNTFGIDKVLILDGIT